MKKSILILVALIAISFNTSALEVNSSQIDTTSNVVSEKVIDDVKSFLVIIGDKTSSGIGKGYDVFVNQQRVYSFYYLSILIVGLIFLIIGVIVILKKKLVTEKENPTPHLFIGIIFICFGVGMSITGFKNLDIIIQGLINPDYAAIKDILRMIKSGLK